MSVVTLKNQHEKNNLPDLQPASADIWDKKYRLKKMNGDAVDANIHETFKRVARALADVEVDDVQKSEYHPWNPAPGWRPCNLWYWSLACVPAHPHWK